MTKHQKRMTTTTLRVIGGLLIVVACIIAAGTASSARSALDTKDFVNKASIGNQFEIESSRLALQSSKNDEVKDFAQRMVDDHTDTANQLKSLLAQPAANVPMPDNKMDSKHAKILKSLNKVSGPVFDAKYLKAQTDAHNEAIALFKTYSEDGDNPLIKNFATKTLPALEEHKQMIPELN